MCAIIVAFFVLSSLGEPASADSPFVTVGVGGDNPPQRSDRPLPADDPRVELVRSLRAAWNRGDIDAAMAERVLLILNQRNRGEAGGVETTNRWALLLSFREGLVSRAESYYEVDEALEAIGSS